MYPNIKTLFICPYRPPPELLKQNNRLFGRNSPGSLPSGPNLLQDVVPHVRDIKDPNIGELLCLLADRVDEFALVRFRLLVRLSEGYYGVALGTGLQESRASAL